MSENIIPQSSEKRRPAFAGIGNDKFWVPVQISPFLQEVRVPPDQFEVAIAWLDHTARSPDRPRKLKTVLRCVGQRALARKLIEKKVLVKNGSGYVLAEECRKHLAYYRDREV